ncbi:hypothetical protein EAX61_11475 [Dokdonia sinensis]|uniref:DUF4258 domain-containing protein n=1 Tax=Dokdonia sinensis TaxID=2479847 RepID=A0A3M0FX89_9FLAO|nr:hypothetical protein [Dokdonia sinensis]RMB57360.1 hypothetical protein EAX61_11475 [Dokdonia sinensis]
MRFIHRLGYYLGGFAIGLVVLAFFLSGKRASCSYFPQARTVKNISIKKHTYSTAAEATRMSLGLDTLAVNELIKTSEVDFDKSDQRKEPCGIFHLESEGASGNVYILSVENCYKEAKILSIAKK